MKISAVAAIMAVALAAIALPCCEATEMEEVEMEEVEMEEVEMEEEAPEATCKDATATLEKIDCNAAPEDYSPTCHDNSHWDTWDAVNDQTTPEEKRLPYGTACEVMLALNISYFECGKRIPAPKKGDKKALEEYAAEMERCVTNTTGMGRDKSVCHTENKISDCNANCDTCCKSLPTCLALCVEQGDKCMDTGDYNALIKHFAKADRDALNALRAIMNKKKNKRRKNKNKKNKNKKRNKKQNKIPSKSGDAAARQKIKAELKRIAAEEMEMAERATNA